jgi:hypothetical protein
MDAEFILREIAEVVIIVGLVIDCILLWLNDRRQSRIEEMLRLRNPR